MANGECRCVGKAEVRDVVHETVHETLLMLGLDVSDPIALQADFRAMREFRLSWTMAKNRVYGVIAATVIGGALIAMWNGIRQM